MNLKLVALDESYREQVTDMIEEWTADIEAGNTTNHSPWAIFKNDVHNYDFYVKHLDFKEMPGHVDSTTLFAVDEDRNRMVGAVNIRHELNEMLLVSGGHIGDGIRPSERRKGYATAMIGLALEKCKELGITEVLMCCDKENPGSAKSIQKNGGVLENEIVVDGEVVQRYWITL